MLNGPKPGQIVLTMTRGEEGDIYSGMRFNFEGIPEDEMEFFHLLKDGMMFAASDPYKVVEDTSVLHEEMERFQDVLLGFEEYPNDYELDYDPDTESEIPGVIISFAKH